MPYLNKTITLIFDDNSKVMLSGDIDRIMELVRGHSFKGFIMHDEPKSSGWDLKALKKILKEKSV